MVPQRLPWQVEAADSYGYCLTQQGFLATAPANCHPEVVSSECRGSHYKPSALAPKMGRLRSLPRLWLTQPCKRPQLGKFALVSVEQEDAITSEPAASSLASCAQQRVASVPRTPLCKAYRGSNWTKLRLQESRDAPQQRPAYGVQWMP